MRETSNIGSGIFKRSKRITAGVLTALMVVTSVPTTGFGALEAKAAADTVTVYRSYNEASGEHLYTTDAGEHQFVVQSGRVDEKEAWVAPVKSNTEVYRSYNPTSGEHLLVPKSEAEGLVAFGWNNEGLKMYSDDEKGVAIYRVFNPNAPEQGPGCAGSHHYTASKGEAEALVAAGWKWDNNGEPVLYGVDVNAAVAIESVALDNTTPKVGETLNAKTTPSNVKDVTYAWYSLDKEPKEVSDIAKDAKPVGTEASYEVKATDEGKFLAVVATDGDKNSVIACTKAVEATSEFAEMTSAEAKKVDVIEATFDGPVNTKDVKITVTKGTLSVPAKVTWDADKKVATITTDAKMTNGTYTVTATSDSSNKKTSKTVEIVSQYVKEIVIENDVALTNANKKEAYAYYDVLDQYGNSMRDSASITWSGSCKATAKKTTGQITLTKNDGSDWVYNDQIFLTGVYTKTGVTVQKTLTIGTEQNMDKVELKGFVKKDTTEILTSLPAGFAADTYYLIYQTVDQNGDPLKVGAANNAVTFVSDNVLVVKQVDAPIANGLTIAGEEYEASFVQPGIKVTDGGDVTVTAIATKTGNKSALSFSVGSGAVITSFTFGAPSGVIADGDTGVEIPFTALDADGNKITDFDTIAKQKTFNELTLTASEGTLELVEEDDGSAKLKWSDDVKYRGDAWLSDSLNGIDRPISLTAVVVGGETDNEMISVSDKRRPDAIAAVDAGGVYVEGDEIDFSYDKFKFYDQYGELIGDDDDDHWGYDNGFFKASKAGLSSSDSDFNGYTFGLRVKYAGSGSMSYDAGAAIGVVYTSTGAPVKAAVIEYNTTKTNSAIQFDTATDIEKVATGEGFKFEIVKTKDTDNKNNGKADDWEGASTEKYVDMSVVDISQVRNLQISDLDRFYVGTLKDGSNDDITGDGVVASKSGASAVIDVSNTTGGLKDLPAYRQTVEVKGAYNGKEVTIPTKYYNVTGDKISDGRAVTDAAIAFDGIVDTIENGLKTEDLYDKTSAKGTSKIAKDTLKVQVLRTYGIAKDVRFVTGGTTGSAANATGLAQTRTYTASAITTTASAASLAADLASCNAQIAANVTAANGRDALIAENNETYREAVIFDTVSKVVEISDQGPKAAQIKNVKSAYTLNQDNTELGDGTDNAILNLMNAKNVDDGDDPIEVVDQYGVVIPEPITMRATNLSENTAGKKDNNMKVSGNDSVRMMVAGAELGDKFDLVLTADDATAQTKITLGADALAHISSDNGVGNEYRDTLLVTLQ